MPDMNIENLEIEEILLPKDQWYSRFIRPGKSLKEVRGHVIHWVANPVITRPSQIAWWWKVMNLKKYNKSPGNVFASAHLNIGKKGQTGMTIPLYEMAYHVGGKRYQDGIKKKVGEYPNSYLIGIECCHTNWKGDMTDETWDSLIKISKYLMNEYGYSKKEIYTHNDITGKSCHRYFLKKENGKWVKDLKKWDEFLEKLS